MLTWVILFHQKHKLVCRFQLRLGTSRTLIYKYILYLLLDVSCYLSWIVSSIKLKLNLRRCYLSALHQIYIKFTFNARKIMTQNNDSKFRHRVSSKIEWYIHTLELVTDLILSLKTGEDFSLKITVTQPSKLWCPSVSTLNSPLVVRNFIRIT